MATSLRRIYAVILLVSVLAGATIALQRLSVERSNKTVGIVVDYYATRDLSLQTNNSLAQVFEAFKEHGVWGVGLEELTVSRAARV